jgi:hypothetical protein
VRASVAVLLLAAASARAAVPAASLGRLADAVAAEVVRVAAGRPVELPPPDDRTGAGLGADLHALLRARLEGRLPLAETGPRLSVTSVLSSAGTRLVWSARIADEAGALVDLVSVSAPWDPALLPLLPVRGGPGAEGVDVVERAVTPGMEGRIVALAFAGEDRLLVLFDDALASYRRDGMALRFEARRDLPGPLAPVRFPGGVLLALESESSCWALSSRSPRAVLFSLEGGRLLPTHQADVVPWPRAAAGVRFRPGTNLLEVALPGVEAPVLALEPDEGWVVGADGALTRAGAGDPPAGRRAGPALARVFPGLVAAAAPDVPGEHDRILLYREGVPASVASLPVDGAVRALASRARGGRAVLAAALEDTTGAFRVALFEVAERK